MEVSMFFTFWGLNVIKKNEGPIKSKGIMRKMLNFMNRGGTKRAGLSKFHMFGMGKWMMGKLMKETKSPTVQELVTMAHESGVKFIACTNSMGTMGIGKDAFIPEVDTLRRSGHLPGRRQGRPHQPVHLRRHRHEGRCNAGLRRFILSYADPSDRQEAEGTQDRPGTGGPGQ